MTAHPIASWWFAVENLTITAGYVFVAVMVAPLFMRRVGVKFWWTKVGGVGFFLLCGITHAQMAVDAVFAPAQLMDMSGNWFAHLVHAPQAVAVWAFVVGLYVELTDVNWTPNEPRTPNEPKEHQ